MGPTNPGRRDLAERLAWRDLYQLVPYDELRKSDDGSQWKALLRSLRVAYAEEFARNGFHNVRVTREFP